MSFSGCGVAWLTEYHRTAKIREILSPRPIVPARLAVGRLTLNRVGEVQILGWQPYGRSAIGSATVSKTVGCRFDSCRPCHRSLPWATNLNNEAIHHVPGMAGAARDGGPDHPHHADDARLASAPVCKTGASGSVSSSLTIGTIIRGSLTVERRTVNAFHGGSTPSPGAIYPSSSVDRARLCEGRGRRVRFPRWVPCRRSLRNRAPRFDRGQCGFESCRRCQMRV